MPMLAAEIPRDLRSCLKSGMVIPKTLNLETTRFANEINLKLPPSLRIYYGNTIEFSFTNGGVAAEVPSDFHLCLKIQYGDTSDFRI